MVDHARSNTCWLLFLEQADSLRAYIQRRVSDPMEADEVFQELGLLVLRHRSGPTDIESIGPWCYALARNVLAHHFRSKRRRANLQSRVELESLAFERSHRIDPERAASARQMLQIMASGLGLEARTLLSQRYLLGESTEEIAPATGAVANGRAHAPDAPTQLGQAEVVVKGCPLPVLRVRRKLAPWWVTYRGRGPAGKSPVQERSIHGVAGVRHC